MLTLAAAALATGCCTSPVSSLERVNQLLAAVTNHASSRVEFDLAMLAISKESVSESPLDWADAVDDPGLDNYRRRKCLFALFTRHAPPGTRLSRLGGILYGREWFKFESFVSLNSGTGLPPHNFRQCCYGFRLPFMKEEHSCLALVLEPNILQEEVVITLNGGYLGRTKVKIIRVDCGDP
jgi:hypothetical protein